MMVESSTWHREFGISKMIMTTTNINHVYLYKIRVYHVYTRKYEMGISYRRVIQWGFKSPAGTKIGGRMYL